MIPLGDFKRWAQYVSIVRRLQFHKTTVHFMASHAPETAFPLNNYVYELPADRIAIHPLEERDASKLFVWRSPGETEHRCFSEVADILPEGSLLVVNHTRVICARIAMQKPTGGIVEVLLTDPELPSRDPAVVLASAASSQWRCLIGGKNVHEGMVLTEPASGLHATVVRRQGAEASVQLEWNGEVLLGDLLDEIGRLPLPPYLHREAEASDLERYQTVYAAESGSVAAPTAGLHFTDRVFAACDARGIERTTVTLHVGMGTFRPVEVHDVRNHVMHQERYGVSRTTLEALLRNATSARPWITAVGTTSIRTLESLFAVGARIVRDGSYDQSMNVGQWEAFDPTLRSVSRADALHALLGCMDHLDVNSLWGETQLMIAPGAHLRCTDALITNFHQPGNTLLLLVAGVVGEDHWRSIYTEALANDYRFLSYGDSSLLFCRKP